MHSIRMFVTMAGSDRLGNRTPVAPLPVLIRNEMIAIIKEQIITKAFIPRSLTKTAIVMKGESSSWSFSYYSGVTGEAIAKKVEQLGLDFRKMHYQTNDGAMSMTG